MNLFEAKTPLGIRVRVEAERWDLIITRKHPVMSGREADVKFALEEPDQIRRSRSDTAVLLFYKAEPARRWICAVVKQADRDDGFLITTYVTDAIKEGEQIWTR